MRDAEDGDDSLGAAVLTWPIYYVLQHRRHRRLKIRRLNKRKIRIYCMINQNEFDNGRNEERFYQNGRVGGDADSVAGEDVDIGFG